MNIEKELNELMFNNKTTDDVVIELENNINEMKKKAYLFKAFSVAKKLEEAVNDDTIKNSKIKFIQVYYSFFGDYYSVRFDILNNNKKVKKSVDENTTDFIERVANPLRTLSFIEPDWTNLTLGNINATPIELKPGIEKKMVELLLSDELIAIYNYNKMSIEVPQENQMSLRKVKI